jgi:hypothetical protein
MDEYEGDDDNPLSLHKYLYADADPVDGLDPSGNDDIGGIGMSETLDAMPSLQFTTVTNSVTQTVAGVQVCARPLLRKILGTGLLRHWHHTYIKILNSKAKNGQYDTYGILGQIDPNTGKGTGVNQQVFKDDYARNSGASPDKCTDCATTSEQRNALVLALEYWSSTSGCPSCGANYHNYWWRFNGHNSNSFTFNMLWYDPAGPITPPTEPNSPGYHQTDSQDAWYPKGERQ